MSNRKLGGLKARDKNLATDPEFYRKIGSIGGKAIHTMPQGFAASTDRASAAGRKGGRIRAERYKQKVGGKSDVQR